MHSMTQPALFTVLVAALFINTLSYCSAENVYCVTPTATSCSMTSCPHNSTHCARLSVYAEEADLYFTSNTTMVFLPGDHVLDRNIKVANVNRLNMLGGSSSEIATVIRKGSVGLSFTNMVDFKIYSLAFTSYYRSWSFGNHPPSSSALFLQSTQYAKLVNCSFHNNIGTALAVCDTDIMLVGNKFIHNRCACKSFSEMHELGCGITALNSILTFTGSASFLKNTQTASYPVYCAGAIWASASSLHFNGTNNFIGNSADNGSGGAIHAENNMSLSFSGSSNFSHNSADVGGASFTYNNVTLVFNGNNNFFNNSANSYGGAIHALGSRSLRFNGTSNFSHNSAYSGGAILASGSLVLTFTRINFFNNSVEPVGSICTKASTSLNFSGASNFSRSSAESCGAINVLVLTFNGTNSFIRNSAKSNGGAIYTENNTLLNFTGTNNFISNSANRNGGGAIVALKSTSLRFTGANNFSHNSARFEGGAVATADNAVFVFTGNNSFFNNTVNSDGGVFYAVANIMLNFTGTSSFGSNLAMQGGAIAANLNSKLTFDGMINFTNNGHNTRDSRGGSLYLTISSILYIWSNTSVCWENNRANLGGAIYVLTANPFVYCKITRTATFIPREKCFFQLPGQNLSTGLDVKLAFKNNSADAAGSVLYGDAIDNCKLTDQDSYNSGKVFDKLVHYEINNTGSNVSSDPFRICPCENNYPDCKKSRKILSVYPGETFQISVVAVGQRNGIVPSAVRSHVDKGRLESSQYIQQTTKACTAFNYTVFSQQDVSLELYADGPCSTISDKLYLQLKISQSCPPGFSLRNSSLSCVCDQALQEYTNHCNITNGFGQITRSSDDNFWVGYDNQSGLTVHPQCPFDNCVSHSVDFSLSNTDIQCAYNRSGVLCGACKDNYSLILGTSHCKPCTSHHLVFLILFALMGIALIFLLLLCNLTVAKGALSGLVFYANIVGVNRTIFLPTDVLPIFIAWINLDFGIETCLYHGLDAYGNTWLQFLFPLYIWVLVGLMVLISNLSQRFANLLGNNPVSVLATLILLSYTKILRTLIAVVSFTNLKYPQDHYIRRAWLYDANVDYLVGKHIPLFIVAGLVFLFLFLPYTLLLLFGQWLQAISHLKLFSWVNSARLKPFMDSYHAPYKAKHRYWPGLLLVLRFSLLLVFALNRQQDPSINLLAILVGAGIPHLWSWVSGGLYRNWWLDALEGSFMLNLTILAAATYHVKLSKGNQLAVGYTSMSIALVTFITILIYHIFLQVRHNKLWKKVPKLNPKFNKLNTKQAVNNNDPTESVNLDQLREPWLEDLLDPTHSTL